MAPWSDWSVHRVVVDSMKWLVSSWSPVTPQVDRSLRGLTSSVNWLEHSPCWEDRSSDCHPRVVAAKPLQHHGEKTAVGDHCNVSGLCCEGEQVCLQTGQRRHQGGGSVVLSRMSHKWWCRHQVIALPRIGRYTEQVQLQARVWLLLRASLQLRL